jgi:hypothetical protein
VSVLPPTREWLRHDYYACLGVAPDAPPSEVDAAYRRLARRWHPDANPADPQAEERFKEVVAAHRVLRDPATRVAYDALRARHGLAPPRPDQARRGPVDHLAPPRAPKARAPLPAWARRAIAAALALTGLLLGVWALAGPLPAPTEADTPGMVQATLAIAAAKLVGSAALVAAYPRLRERFAR